MSPVVSALAQDDLVVPGDSLSSPAVMKDTDYVDVGGAIRFNAFVKSWEGERDNMWRTEKAIPGSGRYGTRPWLMGPEVAIKGENLVLSGPHALI